MNLLIALLSARVPLSRDRIRQFNVGYHGLSDDAFEQAFERDKKEIRELGVRIHTVEVDTGQTVETGYRIQRGEFELPPLDLTSEEKAVLGAAAHVWQESVAADETSAALVGLRAAGIETDASRLMTLRPQLRTDDGYTTAFEALAARRELRFRYRDQPRRVQPWQLHMRRGRWYLLGYDLDRAEPRRFKLQRITSDLQAYGKAGAYEVPEELPDPDFGGEDVDALVALHDDAATELRRDAQAAEHVVALPPGFKVYRIPTPSLELLAAEICSLSTAAIALEPDELVSQVLSQLRHVATRRQP